jgi:signal transduction histidine kinase
MTDLLDFSRTRPTARAEIGAVSLIDEALEKTPPPRHIDVETNIPPNIPALYVDPQQIGQVLGNLITNAYQAMPDGGKLNIGAEAKAGTVQIYVSDTGCGISRENMSKLFEPLFTTKTNGIGLGLTVCKDLIEVNGGNIEVESDEGKGSMFLITLPTKGK